MRNGFVAMVMLMSTAGIASAQGGAILVQAPEVQVTSDDVLARLMFFDRNHDGKVAMGELSERMQPLVIRGDASGDGALDATEIRGLSVAPQPLVTQPQNVSASGRYGFADSVGQSSRMHIDNTIDDLRLSAEVAQQAKRIGAAFADEIEAAARARLRAAIAPMLTAEALTIFDADLARFANARMFVMSDNNGSLARTIVMVGANPATLLTKYLFTPDQLDVATAAAERFKAEQQLDDARRSALVARLSDVLNEEDCDNVRAALARRPLVKGSGLVAVTGGSASVVELMRKLQLATAGR